MLRHPRSGNAYFIASPYIQPAADGDAMPPMSLSDAPAAKPANTKFLLVLGGVCSSLGKGVTTSSVGALLKASGYRVAAVKIDPYINVDAGLMSPYEHGEVFVLGDGGEVDLDLGNYERWMALTLGRDHNITTGKVYKQLIDAERKGDYLGKTVQVVPHFTQAVCDRIRAVANRPVDESGAPPEVVLIELGGTVGDLESSPFMESLRQLRFSLPPEDFCVALVTYLPSMGGSQKTKPTQHSARTLLSHGISPDFLVCRTDEELEASARTKLSQLCGMQEKYIFGAHNVPTLYDVPAMLDEQQIVPKLLHKFRLTAPKGTKLPNFPDVATWRRFAVQLREATRKVRIAFVGKYVQHGSDAYYSVMQTFEHCCIHVGVRIEFAWVDSEDLEDGAANCEAARAALATVDGIFVAGGFGLRGINGKVEAVRIARNAGIPFFGVCLGMQVAVIEAARTFLGWTDATSEEFDAEKKSAHHVLRLMLEHVSPTMGATMRLGAREVALVADPPTGEAKVEAIAGERCVTKGAHPSLLSALYGGAARVQERHRHRYEFNMAHFKEFVAKTPLVFSATHNGTFDADTRVEGIELPSDVHPFFVAVQYHPEFLSYPHDPSPPYLGFVAAVARNAGIFPRAATRAL
jgi:CTP synthase